VAQFKLFDLTVMLARKLGVLREGTATGGSSSTIVDSVLLTQPNDHWNGGSAWILEAGAAAPEDEATRVSDFDQGTATATLSPALSAAVQSGDRYGIAAARYPLDVLIGKLNQALSETGTVPRSDTTVTTVAGQTEYDLPTVDANMDLRQVWEQRRSGAADDNQWVRRYDFHVQRKASGVDKLIFEVAPVSNRLLRLDYVTVHDVEMFAMGDLLDARVHPARVVLQAAVGAVAALVSDPAQANAKLIAQLRDLRLELAKAELDFPIERPKRTTKMLIVGPHLGRRYPGDQTPR
jgi:hypothetical protein